jgi:hypothetical protein
MIDDDHTLLMVSETYVVTPLIPRGIRVTKHPPQLAAWVRTCANHYAAAVAYDDLSRLSDMELKHRGLSRDVLARDLGEWHN